MWALTRKSENLRIIKGRQAAETTENLHELHKTLILNDIYVSGYHSMHNLQYQKVLEFVKIYLRLKHDFYRSKNYQAHVKPCLLLRRLNLQFCRYEGH